MAHPQVNFGRLKFCLAAFFILSTLAATDTLAQSTLIFPQLPAGGDVISNITLTNTNFSAPVSGILSVFNQNGSPRPIAVEGQQTGSSFAVTITAGGSVTLNTLPGGVITVGMAKFVSDFPAGGVVRFQLAGSQLGVLSSPARSFATLVFDTTGGNDAGLAIANAGSTPINVTLVQSGPNGEIIETVDPPELNPLPGNGQVSKFLREYGFTQINNRSSNTVRIQTKGAGQFAALGLLLRGGLLSSTAVVKGVPGKFSFDEFNQAYSGPWRNTTFNSAGTATLTLALNPSASLVAINLTMTGNVFGAPAPAGAVTLVGTYNENGFTATGTSTLFGPTTLTIGADGNWTLTANNVPTGNVATVRITGTAYPDRITGAYTVTFRTGGGASGTIAMNNSGG